MLDRPLDKLHDKFLLQKQIEDTKLCHFDFFYRFFLSPELFLKKILKVWPRLLASYPLIKDEMPPGSVAALSIFFFLNSP